MNKQQINELIALDENWDSYTNKKKRLIRKALEQSKMGAYKNRLLIIKGQVDKQLRKEESVEYKEQSNYLCLKLTIALFKLSIVVNHFDVIEFKQGLKIYWQGDE